jgi:hypothetical protein
MLHRPGFWLMDAFVFVGAGGDASGTRVGAIWSPSTRLDVGGASRRKMPAGTPALLFLGGDQVVFGISVY